MTANQKRIAKLESLVSKIKMRTGLELEIKGGHLELKASEICQSDLYELSRFCEMRGLGYELTGKLTFKIELQ